MRYDAATVRVREALWTKVASHCPGIAGPAEISNRELEDILRSNALSRIQAVLWRRTDRATGVSDDRGLAVDIAAALRGCGFAVPPGFE